MWRIAFFVPVPPAPKGSMRGFWNSGAGKVVVINDNARTKAFQEDVSIVARGAANRVRLPKPAAGPVSLSLLFVMPTPKRKAPLAGAWACKPDLDKLARSVLDALTGVLYVDDQQVDSMDLSKRFHGVGEEPGVDVVAVLS